MYSTWISGFLGLSLQVLVFILRVPPGGAQTPDIIYSLYEELEPQKQVGNFYEDAGLTAKKDQIQVNITSPSGRERGFFWIDTNGVIWTGVKIDREVICPGQKECNVDLEITVQPLEHFDIIPVRVVVTDINDNQPEFEFSNYKELVPEDHTPGEKINDIVPLAVDLDSPKFGIKTYQLTEPSDFFELVVTEHENEPPGVSLVVKKQLDRETTDSYSLTIVAFDGDTPPKSGSMTLDITVTDANDNKPVFSRKEYSVEVDEVTPENTVIIKVYAEDKDIGVNQEIIYGFSEQTLNQYGSYFGIKNETGEIYLIQRLNYEEIQKYSLLVTAEDKGENAISVFTKVNVIVIDVNDHPPFISIDLLSGNSDPNIYEGQQAGGFIAMIKAKDPEAVISRENKVNCSMVDENFELKEIAQIPLTTSYQMVSSKTFDREEKDIYQIVLICHDNDEPNLESSVLINVTVLDINDHSPNFTQDVYTASLVENNAVETLIMLISASDQDLGNNGNITYSIEDLTGKKDKLPVAINNNGEIKAVIEFNYERQSSYEFVVIASDQGTPPLKANATFILEIIDTNDEAPEFALSRYLFKIRENMKIGTAVGNVTAIDPDKSSFGNITYFYHPPNSGYESFQLNPVTGEITTNVMFDREKRMSYSLTVRAANTDAPQLHTDVNVDVTILDENDNPPVINFPNGVNDTILIPPYVPVDYVLARIDAYDPDTQSSQLEYMVMTEDKDLPFEVDGVTGAISVIKDMSDMEPREWRLKIKVKDQGEPPLASTSEIIIIVNETIKTAWIHEPLLGTNRFVVIVAGSGLALVLLIGIIIICCACRNCRKKEKNSAKYNCRVAAISFNNKDGRPEQQTTRNSNNYVDSHQLPSANATANLDLLQAPALQAEQHQASCRTASISMRPDPTRRPSLYDGNGPNILDGRKDLMQITNVDQQVEEAIRILKSHRSSFVSQVSGTDSGKGGSDEGDYINLHGYSNSRNPSFKSGYHNPAYDPPQERIPYKAAYWRRDDRQVELLKPQCQRSYSNPTGSAPNINAYHFQGGERSNQMHHPNQQYQRQYSSPPQRQYCTPYPNSRRTHSCHCPAPQIPEDSVLVQHDPYQFHHSQERDLPVMSMPELDRPRSISSYTSEPWNGNVQKKYQQNPRYKRHSTAPQFEPSALANNFRPEILPVFQRNPAMAPAMNPTHRDPHGREYSYDEQQYQEPSEGSNISWSPPTGDHRLNRNPMVQKYIDSINPEAFEGRDHSLESITPQVYDHLLTTSEESSDLQFSQQSSSQSGQQVNPQEYDTLVKNIIKSSHKKDSVEEGKSNSQTPVGPQKKNMIVLAEGYDENERIEFV